ncbi:hypothetical protein [Chitinophaga nivalis]|uniref:DUF1735 domain-containing protein n=1 Tax=Chitinophaga nivalis TaxID=2991709 RepID=A0ABT3IIW2_9BACT|nr:hypothetical protein [Chitinophaga nivalis]MCW3466404.1 hypothetical protein [Chitinophaga nivalis]MCW3483905.1 hypothetical protein [Chitinophaga nivalis]
MKTDVLVSPNEELLANAVIYNVATDVIQAADITKALESGKTVALKHTKASQLENLFPGCSVPDDLALFAVKQVPIPGYKDKLHTIVTIIPEEIVYDLHIASDNTADTEKHQHKISLSDQQLNDEIGKHIQLQVNLVNSLTPPPELNAYFGLATQNFPYPVPYTQNIWSHNNGSQQTVQVSVTQTYYIYLAKSNNQNQFIVIMVQNGYSQASSTSVLCCNDNQERIFLNSFFTLTNTLSQFSNAYMSSPGSSSNSSNPIIDSISYPMTVLVNKSGNPSVAPFTAQYSNSVNSADWGINLDQNGQSTSWSYYTTNPWNSRTQYFQDFGNWWGQMYSSGNVVGMNNQCTGSVPFDSVAAWTTPASLAQQSVYFSYSSNYYYVGFATPSGTGNGHHQMAQSSPNNTPNTPSWDLIQLTNSSKIIH